MTIDVLLVEDDANDRRLITQSLRKAGEGRADYELREAHDLAAAKARIETKTPDAILLDLGLPDADGQTAITTLAELLPKTPILVLTGSSNESDVASLRAGAQDYMRKDEMTPRNLHHAIQYAIVRAELFQAKLNREARAAADQEWLQGGQERGAPMTAQMIGVRDLREADPRVFRDAAKRFSEILESSFEEQRLKVRHNLMHDLRSLAHDLGALRASHVDVVDIIRDAVESRGDEDDTRRDWTMFEARHRGFQLMGFLVAYYRAQSVGRRPGKEAPNA